MAGGADVVVWAADQRGCALRRIEPDGRTTTVAGPDQLCPKGGAPADRVTLQHLAWDPQQGELVGGGSVLTHGQLFTTVWRIRQDGQARRVLLGHKLGSSPAGAPLDGVNALALDPQGRIHIGTRRMDQDQLAVFRVDEARGTVVQVTGTGLRAGEYLEDKPLDGPAARARFVQLRDMCFAPDGTLYLLDEILVRRLDRQGQMSTWAF